MLKSMVVPDQTITAGKKTIEAYFSRMKYIVKQLFEYMHGMDKSPNRTAKGDRTLKVADILEGFCSFRVIDVYELV